VQATGDYSQPFADPFAGDFNLSLSNAGFVSAGVHSLMDAGNVEQGAAKRSEEGGTEMKLGALRDQSSPPPSSHMAVDSEENNKDSDSFARRASSQGGGASGGAGGGAGATWGALFVRCPT